MNPSIRSLSKDRRRVITDVGIVGLAVAFPVSLQVPFGAITAS